ncbi:MAG: YbaB/EbfC family nucleoid-associated protein [Planctomycetes bacterium]|nr:YbaB/EbfC family nucleoid-associated protein [Planctomycetota bacterium]
MGGMNLGKMMKQAQEMQKQMGKIQEELKERVVEASSGGGMVTVNVNGQQELLAIKINPEVVNKDDVSMLEDLITAAVNEGMVKAKELANEEMKKVTGGMGLPPGLF